jgi:SAM-dependent methyltransferase
VGFIRADRLAFERALVLAAADLRRGRAGSAPPLCVDVGGGGGELRAPTTAAGLRYVNVDIERRPGVDVVADAHALPVAAASVDLVVSTNSLEHVVNAWEVTREIVRVMKPGARALILIPFLHPFHGDDVARYTAYGLRQLLRPLVVERVDAPSHLFTFAGVFLGVALSKLGLPWLAGLARDGLSLGDQALTRLGIRCESWAHSYLVVASKPGPADPGSAALPGRTPAAAGARGER